MLEEKEENVDKVTELLAEYLGEKADEVMYNLDLVYRVNSSYATQNNIPRDIVVQFSSKRMKEDILTKSYKDPLEFEGKTVKVLKELFQKVTESRKQFKPMVD